MNWVLYILIVWGIYFIFSIIISLGKSNDDIINYSKRKVFGFENYSFQYGIMIITTILISVGGLSGFFDQNDIGDEYISELEYLYQDLKNDNVNFQTFQSRYKKIDKLKKEMYVENDELSKKQRIKEVKIIDKIKLLSDEKFKEFESKLENMFD